jgi:uncharacterized membrane protein
MDSAAWTLVIAVFVACVVEMVEATTIVMAMGFTRGWKPALLGVVTALAALTVVTLAAGYALINWLPESVLQLIIGGLLLIFGLQWVRKAILRSAGRQGLHDEDAIYLKNVARAQEVGEAKGSFDAFAFGVSLKGVFLEGMEVVFIVLTFGLNADKEAQPGTLVADVGGILVASLAGLAAVLVVLIIALAVRRPLSMIPENLLKYAVGLLLVTFGSYWSVEGLGIFRAGRESVEWFGHGVAEGTLTLLAILAVWLVVSRIAVAILKVPAAPAKPEAQLEGAAK